jgi:hypothetical protein
MQNRENLKLLGISMITVLLFTQFTSVSASNNQGLVWGIEVNDRFDYNIQVQFNSPAENVTIDDKMYVIVNELNTIPDQVTELADITIFRLAVGSYTTYWENGSIMDSLWLDTISVANPFAVYPLGNWSLLTQILGDAAPVVITQNTTMMNYSLVDYPVMGNVHEMITLKSNGVPHSHLYIRTWDSKTVFMNLTMIQTTTGGADSPFMLILGIGALVTIGVIALVIIRRR